MTAMEGSELAAALAITSAVLVVGVAGFQAALALGLPLGDATFGGKARTEAGVLQGVFRPLAAAQAALLLVIAWVVLARAGVVGFPLFGDAFLAWGIWVIVGFLALNTLANFTAPHPVERWGMGSITLVLAVLAVGIALIGPTL
jgi:hypothetical protein